MSNVNELAARLRQAVQGCTVHTHGPVQAWTAIEEAIARGDATRAEVADLAIGTSTARLESLLRAGVAPDDTACAKERTTIAFMQRLLGDGRPGVTSLDGLLAAVASVRQGVETNPVYSRLSTVEDVRVFMEHHVFAVWDFMCLLKALQRATTSIVAVWRPIGDPEVRRIVNEIVLGEESDLVEGQATSHFELYLAAMRDVGASTESVEQFVQLVTSGTLVSTALVESNAPLGVREFVLTTMDIVNQDRPHAIAAAFTLGREQPIPVMFGQLIRALQLRTGPVVYRRLLAYLDRHVELDGTEHGPAALRLLSALCGEDPALWAEATTTALRALRARGALWDAISMALPRTLGTAY